MAAVEYLPRDFEGLDAGHRAVVRNNAFSRDSRLLFVIINSFASTKDGCYISNARLAFYMGATTRAVQKWIEELKRNDAVSVRIVNKNRREIKIVSKIQVGRLESYEQPFMGLRSKIHTGMNGRSHGNERRFTQGSRVKELEYRNGKKVAKRYPPIAQAIKDKGTEEQRDHFFANYSKWMTYYKNAQPTLAQMIDKLQRSLEMETLV